MTASSSLWQRLLRWFDVPAQDAQQRLVARLLLIATIGSLVLTLSSALYSMAVLRAGNIPRTLSSWLAMGLSNALILGQLALIVLIKRGYTFHLVRLYVTILYGVSLAIFILTGGAYSPQVVFMVWALAVATVFLAQTSWPLWMLIGYGVIWLVLYGLMRIGAYQRPQLATALTTLDGFAVLTLLTILSLIPVLYLIARNFFSTLQQAEKATRELEAAQDALEERMHLFTQTAEERERAFRVLAEVQARLGRVTDLQTALVGAVNYLAEALGFYSINIFLLDQSKSALVLQASSGAVYQDLVRQSFQLSLQEKAIVTEAARTAQPYIAQDVTQDTYYKSTDPMSMTRAEAAFPIIARDTLLGVLDVQSVEVGHLSEEVISLFKAVATALSAVIENVRQFEVVQKAYDRMARLQQQNLLEAWQALVQQRSGKLAYAYDRLAVRPGAARLQDLPPELQTAQEPVVYPTPEGTHLLVVPLKVQQQTVGRFVLESEQPWLKDEIAVATTVIAQLGLALDNARLLDETRRRALLEQAVTRVTANIRAEVELDVMLQTALQELSTLLQAETASARLVLPEEEEDLL